MLTDTGNIGAGGENNPLLAFPLLFNPDTEGLGPSRFSMVEGEANPDVLREPVSGMGENNEGIKGVC